MKSIGHELFDLGEPQFPIGDCQFGQLAQGATVAVANFDGGVKVAFAERLLQRFQKQRLLFFILKLFLPHARPHQNHAVGTPQGDQEHDQVDDIPNKFKNAVHSFLLSFSVSFSLRVGL